MDEFSDAELESQRPSKIGRVMVPLLDVTNLEAETAEQGKSGGLALLWQKSVTVLLQNFSNHHIDVSVQLEGSSVWWRFTGIYGESDTAQREQTWRLLSRLHAQSQRAWLCAGDFNEILDQSEIAGGPPRPNWQIRNFRAALECCELSDLGYIGSPFTWSNRHCAPNTVQERLDRACANSDWSQLFPEASIKHVSMSCSDHVAVVIWLADCPNYTSRAARPWRFEAAWLQSAQCEKVVEESWLMSLGNTAAQGLSTQLDFCRANLKRWSRTAFLADKSRVKFWKDVCAAYFRNRLLRQLTRTL
ncbi:UNVERIFIED_CONTAM: hypothetical protein Slati_2105700 [Sesamum latifolium]|uniref:Endonuclease/exonuclease/phosphatase domain-containing protein n=1 Tax=Sesamum latifolium TaxID=2727402 RepID=A0AAW2WQ15_9LAMI